MKNQEISVRFNLRKSSLRQLQLLSTITGWSVGRLIQKAVDEHIDKFINTEGFRMLDELKQIQDEAMAELLNKPKFIELKGPSKAVNQPKGDETTFNRDRKGKVTRFPGNRKRKR